MPVESYIKKWQKKNRKKWNAYLREYRNRPENIEKVRKYNRDRARKMRERDPEGTRKKQREYYHARSKRWRGK